MLALTIALIVLGVVICEAIARFEDRQARELDRSRLGIDHTPHADEWEWPER